MTRVETVLIVYRKPKILLGFKDPNKKFGGRWNGFGGGVENGESLEECAIRETEQETGIRPKNPTRVGEILFKFETDEQDHEVHIFKAEEYEGVLNTTKDFIEYREFTPEELTKMYDKMMPADRYWLPLFVQEQNFVGEVVFNSKFQVASYNIRRIKNLN